MLSDSFCLHRATYLHIPIDVSLYIYTSPAWPYIPIFTWLHICLLHTFLCYISFLYSFLFLVFTHRQISTQPQLYASFTKLIYTAVLLIYIAHLHGCTSHLHSSFTRLYISFTRLYIPFTQLSHNTALRNVPSYSLTQLFTQFLMKQQLFPQLSHTYFSTVPLPTLPHTSASSSLMRSAHEHTWLSSAAALTELRTAVSLLTTGAPLTPDSGQ